MIIMRKASQRLNVHQRAHTMYSGWNIKNFIEFYAVFLCNLLHFSKYLKYGKQKFKPNICLDYKILCCTRYVCKISKNSWVYCITIYYKDMYCKIFRNERYEYEKNKKNIYMHISKYIFPALPTQFCHYGLLGMSMKRYWNKPQSNKMYIYVTKDVNVSHASSTCNKWFKQHYQMLLYLCVYPT